MKAKRRLDLSYGDEPKNKLVKTTKEQTKRTQANEEIIEEPMTDINNNAVVGNAKSLINTIRNRNKNKSLKNEQKRKYAQAEEVIDENQMEPDTIRVGITQAEEQEYSEDERTDSEQGSNSSSPNSAESSRSIEEFTDSDREISDLEQTDLNDIIDDKDKRNKKKKGKKPKLVQKLEKLSRDPDMLELIEELVEKKVKEREN